MSHMVSRRALGVAGTSAALVAAAALLAQGSANADVFVKLPSQTQTSTLPDGTQVTITRSNESAIIAPSLGGTPLHRAAQVSAKYEVATSKKAKIRITPGYIVGCQVNLSGLNSGVTGTATSNAAGAVTGGTGATQTLTLGPGQAALYYINNVEKADDFGSQQQTQNVDYETKDAKNSYFGSQLQLTGCAGYAQARSFATVRIRTSNVDKQVTFYGKPFSIG